MLIDRQLYNILENNNSPTETHLREYLLESFGSAFFELIQNLPQTIYYQVPEQDNIVATNHCVRLEIKYNEMIILVDSHIYLDCTTEERLLLQHLGLPNTSINFAFASDYYSYKTNNTNLDLFHSRTRQSDPIGFAKLLTQLIAALLEGSQSVLAIACADEQRVIVFKRFLRDLITNFPGRLFVG